MKLKCFIAILFFSFNVLFILRSQDVEVTKIWDSAPHNAFTDLTYFKERYYCTFREAPGHVPRETGEDGKIRVLISGDGMEWKSFALLEKAGYDLRDPKLSITPDNRLMLLFGGSVYRNGILLRCQTHVSFLDNAGNSFSNPKPIVVEKSIQNDFNWLWRVSWFKKAGYGVIYIKDTTRGPNILLVKTQNGVNYSLVSRLHIDGFPNEATVRVSPDGEMIILVRRDDKDQNAYMAVSMPPYQKWEWNDMGLRLGGPNFIPVDSTTFIMGARIYKPEDRRTALFFTSRNGPPRKFLELPSGGDNSYPGMLILNDTLWVSYYSSHEGKSRIYTARIPMLFINKFLKAPQVYDADKIWDYAPHNAFTDLIRYRGKFFCTFREATSHAPSGKEYSPDENGKIRIISSEDGQSWESVSLISEVGIDLRDPKFSLMPDGKLMINCGGSDYSDGLQEWHTRVMFSEDGITWTPPRRVKGIPPNNWFFRLTWYNGTAYAVPFLCGADPETGIVDRYNRKMLLFSTVDGMNYKSVSDTFPITAAGEATIRFKDDKSMLVLIREKGGASVQGILGKSYPPYKEFVFSSVAHGLGGPNFIALPGGKWLVGTREHRFERPGGREGTATVLLIMDDSGNYERVAELISGGDTSYPGMIIIDKVVWVSFYSSHEGKPSIYLSRIPLDSLIAF